MPPLILASSSRYRRALLERLRVPFTCISPGLAEAHLAGESATDRAVRLAHDKAQAVGVLHPDTVVIGSDQVATCEGAVLDKPGDATRCRAQLAHLSGRTAHFYTGCVVRRAAGTPLLHLDITTVVFRTLAAAEIERYVAAEQPCDCAGGFKAEGLGIALFERIESADPTALIGLPLIWLAGALRASGYPLP